MKNFKCFDALELPCAPLTVLTGYNAAGKSTTLQTLLLLAQALRDAAHPPAGRRIVELLHVLQKMMNEMDKEGRLSEAGMELLRNFFIGKQAWFSDESESCKRSEKTFTFPDPDSEGTLVCFWHGKISTPAFRMHFEWPVSPPCERLRIAYIGPHLDP